MTIVKTYLVKYAIGIINPIEKSIKIESIYPLNEKYIKDEICKENPNYKNQIMAIFETILIDEKTMGEESNIEIEEKDNSLPTFNW